MTVQNINELTGQLTSFQSSLQQFALHHAEEIRSNPRFRSEFARMCTAIGVDPLLGGKRKGGWGMLGVGDFWIRIGVRVVGICRQTRSENGGFISVRDVKEMLGREDSEMKQGSGGKTFTEITEYLTFFETVVNVRDDIIRSIAALTPLGPGLTVITLPSGERYIRSIPKELNPDQTTVLEVAGITGFVSVSLLKYNLGWEDERCRSVLEELVTEGMVWIDDAGEEREYWIPRGITDL